MITKYLLAVLFCFTAICALAQTKKDSTKIKKPPPVVMPGGFDSKVPATAPKNVDEAKAPAQKPDRAAHEVKGVTQKHIDKADEAKAPSQQQIIKDLESKATLQKDNIKIDEVKAASQKDVIKVKATPPI